MASSDCYGSGRFDEALKSVLRHYDDIMAVMLPTLREERRRTYSPVLPISPANGNVLQVPVEVADWEEGTIRYTDPASGKVVEQLIISGGAHLQRHVDCRMRWVALGGAYDMAADGKGAGRGNRGS